MRRVKKRRWRKDNLERMMKKRESFGGEVMKKN